MYAPESFISVLLLNKCVLAVGEISPMYQGGSALLYGVSLLPAVLMFA
jgi:hypothetical protein